MRFPRLSPSYITFIVIFLIIILLMNRSNLRDDSAVLSCKFIKEYSQYTCLVKNLKIRYNSPSQTTVTGEHFTLFSNQDVTELVILKCFTIFLPYYISNQFPKLVHFEVFRSHLKIIERKNFYGLSQLTDLRLDHNHIEVLPEDVFYDLENVVFLSLTDNKILELPEKLLEPLVRLNWFTADGNILSRIDKNLITENLKELEAVNFGKNHLIEISVDFSKIEKLKYIDLQDNVCVNVLLKKNYSSPEEFVDEINKNLENCVRM